MLYLIQFHDSADAPTDLRARYMAQHLVFLMENERVILAAGPIREADGSVKSGLWVVDVATVDQAWELVKADPFWPTGLRDRVEIRHWAQVFAAGKVLV
jgi:uncharacterized protein YciI